MSDPASLDPPVDAAPSREAEILAAIRPVFAAKGFDGASMQDLARAAGMSVGNFYRYFPSRAAIVEAIIRIELDGVERQFKMLAAADDPMAALRMAVHQRLTRDPCAGMGPTLWAEINAAALRNPKIGAAVAVIDREASSYLARAFALSTGLTQAEAQQRFSAHARLIVLTIKTSATVIDTDTPEGSAVMRLIKRQIDALLDEIAAAGPRKGRPPGPEGGQTAGAGPHPARSATVPDDPASSGDPEFSQGGPSARAPHVPV